MPNEFLELIERHKLTSPQVAEILNVSVYTVNAWRAKSRHDIPAPMLELLKIKLQRSA